MRQDWQTMGNDEKLRVVKELAARGLSAAQIAAEIGGTTRNAVIGFCSRRKVQLQGVPIAGGHNRPKKTATVIPFPKSRPNRGRVKMMDLGSDTCRRPLFDDPKGVHPDQMFFCGEVTAPSSSWCHECQKVLTEGRFAKPFAIARDGEPINIRMKAPRVRTFDQWRP